MGHSAHLLVTAGGGWLDPGPTVGNISTEPSSSTSHPKRGCAWSPRPESAEEPLLLPTFSPAAQARVAATFVLFVLSAGCNVAVLRAAGGRRGGGRSHIRVLLRHLAAADLLVTVVVMPLDAIWNITLQWRAGDLACRLLMYLRLLAMYASAFVTVVISLDRQAAILRPLAIARARCRNRAMLRAAWMLSAALAVPQVPAQPHTPCTPGGPQGLLRGGGAVSTPCRAQPCSPGALQRRPETLECCPGEAWALHHSPFPPLLCFQLFLFHTVTLHAPHNFTQCTTHGSFPQPWHETLYNMLSFSCLFLLPLLIMVCCYTRILLEISRRMGSSLCEWGWQGGCEQIRVCSLDQDSGGPHSLLGVWFPSGPRGRAPRSLVPFPRFSLLQGRAAAVLWEQHPTGTAAHAEDEPGHRLLLHPLLDPLLPAGAVVLVLSTSHAAEGPTIPLPHPLHLWPLQCLPGPHHLWALHHPLPEALRLSLWAQL